MVRVLSLKKFLTVAFISLICFFSSESCTSAQIVLKDQSCASSQQVEITFENQSDIDNLIVAINDVCGDSMFVKRQKISQIRECSSWIHEFSQLICKHAVVYLMGNDPRTIEIFCRILAHNISGSLQKMGDSFVMVSCSTVIQKLEEFITIYLSEETIAKHTFPYSLSFCA